MAKKSRPFSDHSDLIDLQSLNGVNVGRLLHSRTTCVSIVEHVADEMVGSLMRSITQSNVPVAILIDESTTLSNKACLIVYIRCSIADSEPITLFLDLVELSGTTAADISAQLLACLYCGFLEAPFNFCPFAWFHLYQRHPDTTDYDPVITAHVQHR